MRLLRVSAAAPVLRRVLCQMLYFDRHLHLDEAPKHLVEPGVALDVLARDPDGVHDFALAIGQCQSAEYGLHELGRREAMGIDCVARAADDVDVARPFRVVGSRHKGENRVRAVVGLDLVELAECRRRAPPSLSLSLASLGDNSAAASATMRAAQALSFLSELSAATSGGMIEPSSTSGGLVEPDSSTADW